MTEIERRASANGKMFEVHKAKMVNNVTAPMPGTIVDWPANIQDRFYALMEQTGKLDGVEYQVVHSESGVDPSTNVAYALVVIEGVKLFS